MKIGILVCGRPPDEIRETYGDYFAMFSRLLDGQGLDFACYNVDIMEFPTSASDCDGWLISGSKHGVYEDHAYIPVLEDLVREANAAHIPMVGVCFGHQIIAQALGGRVEKFKGGWAVGRVEYRTDDGGTLTLNAWHQDQVMTPPKGARTTARSDFCAHAALVYPNGIWTMQPHPEFDNELIRVFLQVRGRAAGVPEHQLEEALNDPPRPIDNMATATNIADHFKKHAKVPHV